MFQADTDKFIEGIKEAKRQLELLKKAAYQTAVDIGAAGVNNRARTIPSKRDKENDPKRQRKSKEWLNE